MMKSTVLVELLQLLVDATERATMYEKEVTQLKAKLAQLEKAASNGGVPLGEEKEAETDGNQTEH